MPLRSLLFFGFAAALVAADAPSLDDRLRALESKVDALQKENAELRRALGAPALAAPHADAATTATAPADPLMPAGKETKVVIGGFTQAQAEFGGTGML